MSNWRDTVMTGDRRQQVEASDWVSARVAGRILGVTSRRVLQLVRERVLAATYVDDGYCGQFIFSRATLAQVAREGRTRRKAVRRMRTAPRPAQPAYEVVWNGCGPLPGQGASEAWRHKETR